MTKYTKAVQKGINKFTAWIQPIKRGYKFACCDCGLVHNAQFRVSDGRVQWRVKRNTRATAAKRRKLKMTKAEGKV